MLNICFQQLDGRGGGKGCSWLPVGVHCGAALWKLRTIHRFCKKKRRKKKGGKKSFACKFEPASSMNPNLLETERVNPTLSNEIGPGSNFQSNLKFFENVKKFPRLKASHDLYPSGTVPESTEKPTSMKMGKMAAPTRTHRSC